MSAHGHVSAHALLRLQTLAGNRAVQRAVEENKFNIVGEDHDETDLRETFEQDFAKAKKLDYWRESKFEHGGKRGDQPVLCALQKVTFLAQHSAVARHRLGLVTEVLSGPAAGVKACLDSLLGTLPSVPMAMSLHFDAKRDGMPDGFAELCSPLVLLTNRVHALRRQLVVGAALAATLRTVDEELTALISAAEVVIRRSAYWEDLGTGDARAWTELVEHVSWDRAVHMLHRANKAAANQVTGIWKVGQDHVAEMSRLAPDLMPGPDVKLTDVGKFKRQFEKWHRKSVS